MHTQTHTLQCLKKFYKLPSRGLLGNLSCLFWKNFKVAGKTVRDSLKEPGKNITKVKQHY